MNTQINLAIVFPGQGSQSVGMMNELLATESELSSIFDSASEVLGYDLLDIINFGPEKKLNQTKITQPALVASAYATWLMCKDILQSSPTVFAGHSLGEYTALVCAGVIEFQDAIALVAERGKCMQKAVPLDTGAMAAILGLENEQIAQICIVAAENEIVSAANFNSPEQVVIAGDKSAVERAIVMARDIGAKRALLLPVSVPSHCWLMKEAADEFAITLNKTHFNDAETPVIQNVNAEVKTKSNEIKKALLEQLYMPVHWVDSINRMQSMGVNKIIECGPGKVLSGLIKRIDRSIQTHSVQNKISLMKALN
ncbi:ACP S-malonyltransferase [Gammaproteobacteria bacterium]|nr:ACP S-malonyltransferase [Gammaproteobacteria bacterium]